MRLSDRRHLIAVDAAYGAIEARGKEVGLTDDQIGVVQALFSDGFEAAYNTLDDDEHQNTTVPPQFHGGQFGIDWFEPSTEYPECGPGPCVRVWSEDDGNWHLVMTFDATWLPELARVANAAVEVLPVVQQRAELKLRAQKFLERNDQRTDEARHLIRSLLLLVPGT